MACVSKWFGLTALAGVLLWAPAAALAAPDGRSSATVRRADETVERLRAELARVNAEVARLKRSDRSIRRDYRLRERMADAEALAQKLTAAEAKLRELGGGSDVAPLGAPVVAAPEASPQDGSVELEAKADLLTDQARKLDGEADVLAKAADQLRSRRALRRRAGGWERDPFVGLETSRRNLAASAASPKVTQGATSSDGERGSTTAGASLPPPTVTSGTASGGGVALAPGAAATPTIADSATKAVSSDGATSLKSSPLSPSADRLSVEQRLYLDPATVAELRHALGSGGAPLDPDALDRGSAALRARARALVRQARDLRAKSRTP